MRLFSLTILFASLLFLLASTGCNTLRPGARNPSQIESMAAASPAVQQAGFQQSTEQPATDGPYVKVSVKPERGRVRTKTIPLTEGMTVQQALAASGDAKRFKGMEIKVHRVTPLSNGQRVPLNVEFDPIHKQVSVLHDITLHHDDHIAVKEDDSNQFKKAMNAIAPFRETR